MALYMHLTGQNVQDIYGLLLPDWFISVDAREEQKAFTAQVRQMVNCVEKPVKISTDRFAGEPLDRELLGIVFDYCLEHDEPLVIAKNNKIKLNLNEFHLEPMIPLESDTALGLADKILKIVWVRKYVKSVLNQERVVFSL